MGCIPSPSYGRPIQLNREGEWISTDNCECIVDRQDDGVRRQSGIFKAIVDNVKEAFYTSKESKPLEDFASSSEEESLCLAGEVKQTAYGSVGLKQDGKREAMSQLREERRGGRQTKMIRRMSLRTLE